MKLDYSRQDQLLSRFKNPYDPGPAQGGTGRPQLSPSGPRLPELLQKARTAHLASRLTRLTSGFLYSFFLRFSKVFPYQCRFSRFSQLSRLSRFCLLVVSSKKNSTFRVPTSPFKSPSRSSRWLPYALYFPEIVFIKQPPPPPLPPLSLAEGFALCMPPLASWE